MIKPDRKRNLKYINKGESQRKQNFTKCEGLLDWLLELEKKHFQKIK